jgi:hypothetical protein
MSIQKRIVQGHNVLELSHLREVRAHEAGRHCFHCGQPVNRYQEAAICCRCEDAGLEVPLPQIEVAQPVALTEDVFRRHMPQDVLRDALQEHFGSMALAARYLGLVDKGLYNYTSKHFRPKYHSLPQKHIDRLNAYVRGEVK